MSVLDCDQIRTLTRASTTFVACMHEANCEGVRTVHTASTTACVSNAHANQRTADEWRRCGPSSNHELVGHTRGAIARAQIKKRKHSTRYSLVKHLTGCKEHVLFFALSKLASAAACYGVHTIGNVSPCV